MGGGILLQVLILLVGAVAAVIAFQRARIPSSLGYLLVGLVVGPHAFGLVPDSPQTRLLGELGIVFLLFTIGLNFSLPQIMAMRNQVLGMGTAQVALTTAVIMTGAWLAGLPLAAAFVLGAVFAQSSTTIISKQLVEQGEDQTRHGRLGVAVSVFQDVTAVPFVVIIPVLGAAATSELAMPLFVALLKAASAFVLIFLLGRWLLKPIFHEVAIRGSSELFTLTVLTITLIAASITGSLGLSLALGAFLAGMMLGETEFRHQVESSIRPFRDVLLGLFFVTIGMLVNLAALNDVWLHALVGAAVLLAVKIALVTAIVRLPGFEARTALRTGLLVAVGGEFGLALLAMALDASVIREELAQTALYAVLFSMIAGSFLIRYNRWLSGLVFKLPMKSTENAPRPDEDTSGLHDHVIICGYGRVGQNVARTLEDEGFRYVAIDLDASRVREAHAAGLPVYYADAAEHTILETIGIFKARLIVVAHDDLSAARKLVIFARSRGLKTPIMVRTRDESHVDELLELGATEVVPETIEASIMIASQALILVGVPLNRVIRRMRGLQANRYQLMRELFPTESAPVGSVDDAGARERLHTIVIPDDSYAVGKSLGDLGLRCREVQSLVRAGVRHAHPDPSMRVEIGDALIVFGTNTQLRECESQLCSAHSPEGPRPDPTATARGEKPW